MLDDGTQSPGSVPQHMLDAALRRLLVDDDRKVSTRQVAAVAATNVSMIRYYFGNKEGLYEEMNRATLQPLLDVLDGPTLSAVACISDFVRLYYTTTAKRSEFPKLIFRVLALNQGLGKRFIHQLLERCRTQGRTKIEAPKAGASRLVERHRWTQIPCACRL